MVILVLNCGSSSIKYQVIDMEAQSSKLLAKGLVERIGLPEGDLTHKPVGKEKFELHQPIPDHTTGISLVLQALTDPVHGVIRSLDEVKAVGHRVAHGGEFFPESCLVTEQVQEKIRSLFQIAPLHNPANLEGILSIEKVLPGVKQVAVFDTSFHQTLPATNFMYALPYEYYQKYGIRKYGFHGTSHKFVAREGAKLAGLDINNSKIITCHIGNVDPSAVTFIGEKEQMSYAEVNNMLNKQSGVFGVSGVSSDMRDIDKAYEEGNPRAILARDMYCLRIKKFVGEYAAEMGGVDLIVFTGGVGENSPETRKEVCEGLEFMGVHFDRKINEGLRGENKIISAADSKVKVAVVPTNEELVIATDTYEIVNK